jgi:hypothetical protein
MSLTSQHADLVCNQLTEWLSNKRGGQVHWELHLHHPTYVSITLKTGTNFDLHEIWGSQGGNHEHGTVHSAMEMEATGSFETPVAPQKTATLCKFTSPHHYCSYDTIRSRTVTMVLPHWEQWHHSQQFTLSFHFLNSLTQSVTTKANNRFV